MSKAIKSASVIEAEGNTDHRSKADLKAREQAEKAVLTGQPIEEGEEVASHPVAHTEFERLISLMDNIGRNDELYGATVRRYCLNTAELKATNAEIASLTEKYNAIDDVKLALKVKSAINTEKRNAKQLRDSLDKFENDNGMTISASLRMISKKPEKKPNPIKDILFPDGNVPAGYHWD